jgi:hypothetical protein
MLNHRLGLLISVLLLSLSAPAFAHRTKAAMTDRESAHVQKRIAELAPSLLEGAPKVVSVSKPFLYWYDKQGKPGVIRIAVSAKATYENGVTRDVKLKRISLGTRKDKEVAWVPTFIKGRDGKPTRNVAFDE